MHIFKTSIAVIGLLTFLSLNAHAETVTLKYSNYYPESSAVSQHIHKPVLESITKGTNGAIQFQEYWASSLHSLPDGFKAARSGLTDITQAYCFTLPTSFNLPHCDSLPFAFSNSVVGSLVMEELYAKYFKKEYEKQGVYCAMYPVLEYTGIISKTPIRTLEDLKGKKLYIPGGMLQDVYKKLGVTPVLIAPAELFQALQRGILDGALYPAGLVIPQRYHEVCRYWTNATICYGAIPFAMNRKKFDALSDPLKKTLYYQLRQANVLMGKLYYDMDRAAIEEMQKAGVEIIDLSPAEKERWVNATASIWEEFIEQNEKKGLPARQLCEDIKALNSKFSAMSMDELMDYAAQNPAKGIITGF